MLVNTIAVLPDDPRSHRLGKTVVWDRNTDHNTITNYISFITFGSHSMLVEILEINGWNEIFAMSLHKSSYSSQASMMNAMFVSSQQHFKTIIIPPIYLL